MKFIIHRGHFGLKNLKKHACQVLFWPLINSEIEDMIKNCPVCLTSCNRQPSEPTIKHPVLEEHGAKLAADLFWLYGYYYLLVVDYNSKIIVIENLKDLQSLTAINKCKKIFLQYGIPKKLITINRPEFISHHFKKFSKIWDFKHQTASLHYHQPNGLVEWSIQTVKQTLKKAKYDQQDEYLDFLFLNLQPNENGISLAQKWFNCQLRTTCPQPNPYFHKIHLLLKLPDAVNWAFFTEYFTRKYC